MADHFALDDYNENPHPRMTLRALELRRRAKISPTYCQNTWLTYREAMTDATGATPAQLDAWLDRVEADLYKPRP